MISSVLNDISFQIKEIFYSLQLCFSFISKAFLTKSLIKQGNVISLMHSGIVVRLITPRRPRPTRRHPHTKAHNRNVVKHLQVSTKG